jgi:hypothetical protein
VADPVVRSGGNQDHPDKRDTPGGVKQVAGRQQDLFALSFRAVDEQQENHSQKEDKQGRNEIHKTSLQPA